MNLIRDLSLKNVWQSLHLKSKIFVGIEVVTLLVNVKSLGDFFLYWTILSFVLIVIDFMGDDSSGSGAGTFMSEQGRYATQTTQMDTNKAKNDIRFFPNSNANRLFDISIFSLNLLLYIIGILL